MYSCYRGTQTKPCLPLVLSLRYPFSDHRLNHGQQWYRHPNRTIQRRFSHSRERSRGRGEHYLGHYYRVLLSIIAVLGAEYFIPLYQLEAQVEQYAQEYLFISGALTFNVTIGVVLTTILRSHGYSKSPMVINLIAALSMYSVTTAHCTNLWFTSIRCTRRGNGDSH